MMSFRVNSLISSSSTFSLLLHKPKPTILSLSFKPISQTRKFSIKMFSSSTQTIEHIVLFKVNEQTEPTKINTMLNRLNNLISLDQVLHLSAGPIFRNKSSSVYNYTHLLHSRYKSKEDLNAYGIHPDHQSVVKEAVLPICDDIMAVDWVSHLENGSSSLVVKPGSAMKITFLKLKDGLGESEKEVVLDTIGGIRNGVGRDCIEQISFGENFCARAKGFSIGSIAVCRRVLDRLDLNQEKEKVRDLLDGFIVLDYVVPNSLSPANL